MNIKFEQLKQEFQGYYEYTKEGAQWQLRILGITYRGGQKALDRICAESFCRRKSVAKTIDPELLRMAPVVMAEAVQVAQKNIQYPGKLPAAMKAAAFQAACITMDECFTKEENAKWAQFIPDLQKLCQSTLDDLQEMSTKLNKIRAEHENAGK